MQGLCDKSDKTKTMHDKAWLIAKAKKGQGLCKRAYISNKSDPAHLPFLRQKVLRALAPGYVVRRPSLREKKSR